MIEGHDQKEYELNQLFCEVELQRKQIDHIYKMMNVVMGVMILTWTLAFCVMLKIVFWS